MAALYFPSRRRVSDMRETLLAAPLIRIEPFREFDGIRERGHVCPVHLVGREAESFLDDAPLELGRKEPVVAAQQEAGRNVGPGREWPRLEEGRARLLATMFH